MSQHRTPRTSIAKTGGAKIVGDVELAEGSGVAIAQSGKTLTLSLAEGALLDYVFQPGGTAGPGVYTSWSDLMTDFGAATVKRGILLDDSVTSPVVIPAGTWDLESRPIRGLREDTPVTLGEGVVFQNWNMFERLSVTCTNTSTPIITLPSGQHWIIRCQILMSGTAPLFEVSGVACNLFIDRTPVGLAASVTPFLNFASNHFCLLGLIDISSIDADMISGSTGIAGIYRISGNNTVGTQSTYSGTISEALLVQAAQTAYAPDVPGDWSPAPDDVAEALDQLAASGGGGGTDEKVKVSANDTTSDYLFNKLAGTSDITITELNDGSDEDAEVSLADTTATPGSYGGSTQVPILTVDQKGRITSSSQANIAIPSSQVSDFNEAAQDAVGGILTDSASIDFTYDDGANTITAAVLPAGVDHGGLGGLTDDDHAQYALLAGRSGGQTLQGGTASGNNLTLESTSNATKGLIRLGAAGNHVFDDVNKRLGLGTNAPAADLHIKNDTADVAVRLETQGTGAYISTSAKFPATTAEDTSVGTKPWNDYSLVKASDNNRSTAVITASATEQTYYIKCTDFGFNVPATATITGVSVFIERSIPSTAVPTTDKSVRLVKGGTITGSNLATATAWPLTSDSTEEHGGTSNLWGTTLTPADVNASTFGCVVSAETVSGIGIDTIGPRVDAITMKVHYQIVEVDYTLGTDFSDGGALKLDIGTAVGGNTVLRMEGDGSTIRSNGLSSAKNLIYIDRLNDKIYHGGDSFWDYAANEGAGVVNITNYSDPLPVRTCVALYESAFGFGSLVKAYASGKVLTTELTALGTLNGNIAQASNADFVWNGDTKTAILKADAASDVVTMSNGFRLIETGGGSDYAGMVAPSAITSSYTLKLPTAGPGSNQVIKYDASGNGSWTTLSGGGGGASYVRKSSDQSTTTTSMADVTGMSFSVDTSSVYFFEGMLIFAADSATPDVVIDFTGPAGATFYCAYSNPGGSDEGTLAAFSTASDRLDQLTGATPRTTWIRGVIATSGTGGTLQLRFAQATLSSTSYIKQHSWIKYQKE